LTTPAPATIIGCVRARGLAGLGLALALWLLAADAALAEPRTTSLGTSQAGAPLTLYSIGDSTRRVLIVGGQHGGPEVNTVQLASALLDWFDTYPEALRGLQLDVLLAANPDGLAAGSRQFRSGVDPNRNWGGADWRADAYDSNAVFRVGLGGPEPFSEPETRALGDFIVAARPVFIVNYHSAGGFMFGGRDGDAGALSAAYADASGYPWPGGSGAGAGQRSPLPYSASGSMNAWLRQVSVPSILVELSTARSAEIERNLNAVLAVLAVLAPD
jgi:hypothetical protein